MTANPFVGTGRIAWMEVWSHLRSPRLIILAVLFALAVVGAAYGLSQPRGGFQNEPDVFGHPVIANESGVLHYRVVAWVADPFGTPVSGQTLSLSSDGSDVLSSNATNTEGFVSFDVGNPGPTGATYVLRMGQGGVRAFVSFDRSLENQTFTSFFSHRSFGTPSGSQDVYSVHVLALDGTPATTADVYVNDTLVGHPTANGYFRFDVPPGEHTVRIVFQGDEESFPVFGGTGGTAPVFASGADSVLIFLAVGLMPLFLPVVAIAVSFDAIARERVQGSLELLLARRVRREGILLGKFLGAFASIALPAVAVLLAGIGVVTLASGRAPSFGLGAAFILASLFLIGVYVLLMLIFSTLAKSVGTAVVFGVVVWIVFNVLFSFLAFLLLFRAGVDPTSRAFYDTLTLLYLFDPNTLYQLLVSLAFPSTGASLFLVPSNYINGVAVVSAGLVWIVGLLVVATFLFARKSEV